MTSTEPAIAEPNRTGLLWPALLTLAGLCVLIGLGSWQLQRKTWKDSILAKLEAQATRPPLDVTASWPDLPCETTGRGSVAPRAAGGSGLEAPCEYQPVSVRGVFDHTRERHIFTAAPKAPGVPSTVPGGFWVMTPLTLEGSARTVYVNRGFVPEPIKERDRRVDGLPAGPVEVVGLYRSAQKRATFDGASDPARNIWYVRDPAELWGDPSGLAYIDMKRPAPTGGWPLPLAGKVELTNRHLEYALTWYGLAVTLICVFAAFAWGRMRRR